MTNDKPSAGSQDRPLYDRAVTFGLTHDQAMALLTTVQTAGECMTWVGRDAGSPVWQMDLAALARHRPDLYLRGIESLIVTYEPDPDARPDSYTTAGLWEVVLVRVEAVANHGRARAVEHIGGVPFGTYWPGTAESQLWDAAQDMIPGTAAAAATMADDHDARQLDRLFPDLISYEVVYVEDGDRYAIIHSTCGKEVCDIEHDDSMFPLVMTAMGHDRSCH